MSKKILVCDDEPDTRDLVKAIMDSEGFEVDTAEDGSSCIQKMKKTTFDLVLLDIMMPGLTPKEIIAEMKKLKGYDKTKVTYFSAVEFPATERKKMLSEKNVVGYIQKPFTNDDLVKTVRKFLK